MADSSPIPNRVHIVGAGGAGMSALAKLLTQLGHEVSGSDVKPGRMLDSVRDVGAEVWIGHEPDRMAEVDLVVASSAVPASDPELSAAHAANVTIWKRPALLSALTDSMPAIGLAGTHGKTTSTALLVAAMRGADKDPSFIVGGQMIGLNTGAHLGADSEFVLEADEAFGTFRHLNLKSILVTNIEADHLDHYGTLAALEDAFAQVVGRVQGPRIVCIDDPGVRRLAQRLEVTTYGLDPGADWVVQGLTHANGRAQFVLRGPDQRVDVDLPKPGAHFALNAAGVLAMAHASGVDVELAAAALKDFKGVRRRYEIVGRVNDITIVDDYAHHPTEVAATISAAREGSDGSVVAVFQPHRYTRTADLAPLFGEPLAGADRAFVTDVYGAGEPPMIGVSGRIVVEAVDAAGGRGSYVPKIADLPDRILAAVRPGDTVVLMGAGDINSIAADVLAGIEAS